MLQDQIKLDRFTLVLSGRNDWVSTNNANHIGPGQDRERQPVFRARRPDLQFRLRPRTLRLLCDELQPGHWHQCSGTIAAARDRRTGRGRLRSFSRTASTVTSASPWFDLKRQNALTTDPNNVLLQTQNGEVTSRGLELEAVANPLTGPQGWLARSRPMICSSARTLNPALIGKAPTTTPQQMASAWVDYTFQERPLTGFGFGGGVALCRLVLCRHGNTCCRFPPSCSATPRIHYEWQNWRAALERHQHRRHDLCRELLVAGPPASMAIGVASRRASATNGDRAEASEGGRAESANRSGIWSVVHTWTSLISTLFLLLLCLTGLPLIFHHEIDEPLGYAPQPEIARPGAVASGASTRSRKPRWRPIPAGCCSTSLWDKDEPGIGDSASPTTSVDGEPDAATRTGIRCHHRKAARHGRHRPDADHS